MATLTREQEGKARQIFYRAAGITGIGIGLFFVALIAPLIHNSADTFAMQAVFVKYGLLVLVYTGVMLATYYLMRKWMVRTNFFMQLIYLPTLVLMFGLETYEILLK
jgi:hypothetical protein